MLHLSSTERRTVEAAVATAEQRTAARLAVVVAHRADDYAAYPMLYAAAIALIVGDLIALARPDIATWWIVAIQAGLFIVSDLLLHLKPLRYRIVPPRVRKNHAHKLARLEFAALLHDRAPDEAGLLLFLAEAERHVEILPSAAIAACIAPAQWQQIVAETVAGIATNRTVAALTGAVEACAVLLAADFPSKPGAAAGP